MVLAAAHFFLRNARHRQYPLNNFLKNEFGFELQVLMRSCCNKKLRGDSDMTSREHTGNMMLNLFAL